MPEQDWTDQYRRMRRSYHRLKLAVDQYIERQEVHEKENSRDAALVFFMDAFHLRDHIHESKSLDKPIRKDVWNLFDDKHAKCSKELCACRNLANCHKHMVAKKWKLEGGDSAGITIPFTLPAFFTYHYTVEAPDGKKYDVADLADRAVAAWDAWLTGHGVRLPQ